MKSRQNVGKRCDKDSVRHFLKMNKIVPGGLLKVKKQSLAIKKRRATKAKAAQPLLKKSKSLIVSIPCTNVDVENKSDESQTNKNIIQLNDIAMASPQNKEGTR